MLLITYDEYLNKLCDDFDSLISPRQIARSNSNIIYLILKAVAKGFEVINALCVTLSNKFDPARCSVEDLNSVADLVGTKKLAGSASGLYITVHNDNSDSSVTLLAGRYTYVFNDDLSFMFTVNSDLVIPAGGSKQLIALSDKVGKYEVTAQADISVTAVNSQGESVRISSDLSFSCANNMSLLGTPDESNLDFRKRILSDTARQDALTELETRIRNLPYIFDCKVVFNPTADNIIYDDYTIPPFYLLLMISGDMREELAEIIASCGIYPTVMTDSDRYLVYYNNAFANGSFRIYYTPFRTYDYTVNVIYKSNPEFVSDINVQNSIRNYLFTTFNTNVHVDTITEQDIYSALMELNLTGVKLLSIELYVNSNRVNYITVPRTRIPNMTGIVFNSV